MSTIQHLKGVLKDSLERELALFEAIKESVDSYFSSDKRARAKAILDDHFEYYENNGFFPNFSYIQKQLEEEDIRVKEWQAKQAEKSTSS